MAMALRICIKFCGTTGLPVSSFPPTATVWLSGWFQLAKNFSRMTLGIACHGQVWRTCSDNRTLQLCQTMNGGSSVFNMCKKTHTGGMNSYEIQKYIQKENYSDRYQGNTYQWLSLSSARKNQLFCMFYMDNELVDLKCDWLCFCASVYVSVDLLCMSSQWISRNVRIYWSLTC